MLRVNLVTGPAINWKQSHDTDVNPDMCTLHFTALTCATPCGLAAFACAGCHGHQSETSQHHTHPHAPMTCRMMRHHACLGLLFWHRAGIWHRVERGVAGISVDTSLPRKVACTEMSAPLSDTCRQSTECIGQQGTTRHDQQRPFVLCNMLRDLGVASQSEMKRETTAARMAGTHCCRQHLMRVRLSDVVARGSGLGRLTGTLPCQVPYKSIYLAMLK